MKIVSMDEQKVVLPSLEDANQLLGALIAYNCEATLKKFDSFGEQEKTGDYAICFDDYEVNIIGKGNTLTVVNWLLSLGVSDIFIKRADQ